MLLITVTATTTIGMTTMMIIITINEMTQSALIIIKYFQYLFC